MAIAGFRTHISVATGQYAVFLEMDGAVNYNSQDFRDMLDSTDFSDDDLRRRTVGLHDVTLEISGQLALEDEALSRIRQAFRNEAPIYIRILHDSSNGFMAPFLVEDVSSDASVDDLVTVSISLKASGEFSPQIIENMSLNAPTISLDALPYERTVTMGTITLSGTYTQTPDTISWAASPSGLSGNIPFSGGTFSGPVAAGDGVQTITVTAQNAFGSDTATATVGFYVAGAHTFFSAQNIDGNWNATLSHDDAIAEWVNTGTSSLNVIQATPSAQPTYKEGRINGQPTAYCDGGDLLNAATATDWTWLHDGTDKTFYVVKAREGTTSGVYFRTSTTAPADIGIRFRDIATTLRQSLNVHDTGTTRVLYEPAISRTPNNFYSSQMNVVYDGTQYSTTHRYNAANVSTVNLTAPAPTATPAFPLRLFEALLGDAFCTLLYQSDLTVGQSGSNEAVTAWALGDTLPITFIY